jgi:hypothetical protein
VTNSEIVGSTGVTLLLGAFAATSFGRLSVDSKIYHLVNAVGAGLSCAASAMIGFVPFVVLEGTWALVALLALVRLIGQPQRSRER